MTITPVRDEMNKFVVGAELRRLRIQKNLSLEASERKTGIPARLLGMLEDGQWELLPGGENGSLFLLYLERYKQFLGFDMAQVSRSRSRIPVKPILDSLQSNLIKYRLLVIRIIIIGLLLCVTLVLSQVSLGWQSEPRSTTTASATTTSTVRPIATWTPTIGSLTPIPSNTTAPTSTPRSTPTITNTPTVALSPTVTPTATATPRQCHPMKLWPCVGDSVVAKYGLSLRKEPDMGEGFFVRYPSLTIFTVINGPEAVTDDVTPSKTYYMFQLRASDGTEGWAPDVNEANLPLLSIPE